MGNNLQPQLPQQPEPEPIPINEEFPIFHFGHANTGYLIYYIPLHRWPLGRIIGLGSRPTEKRGQLRRYLKSIFTNIHQRANGVRFIRDSGPVKIILILNARGLSILSLYLTPNRYFIGQNLLTHICAFYGPHLLRSYIIYTSPMFRFWYGRVGDKFVTQVVRHRTRLLGTNHRQWKVPLFDLLYHEYGNILREN